MRTFLMMFALCIVFFGCGGEEADTSGTGDAGAGGSAEPVDVVPEGDTVVGTWEVIEVTRGEDISNTGTVYVFTADGYMSSSSGAFTIEGTYTVVDDTLKIILGGIDMDILHGFDGGNLVYEIINGDQVFLMERI